MFTSTLPIAVEFGSTIEPPVDAAFDQALHQRLAGDRRGRRVLAGVADAVAVEDVAVERVGGGDRNAVRLRGLDDVVIGADLRRRHDQAVERRILEDLVEDLDLAGRIVDRRLRSRAAGSWRRSGCRRPCAPT